MAGRRAVTDEMPEANYLVGHPDGPYYRLILRCFYERHRAHAGYVRSDELVDYVRRYFAYDPADCRRHLEMLERWGLITSLPEQTRPASLQELRQKPRVYRAERLAMRLEELRVQEEEGEAAAALDPAALDRLVDATRALAAWIEGGGLLRGEGEAAYRLWSAVYEVFSAFSRRVEEYLSDLPRHRPREVLDYPAFLQYRDLVTRYLSDYARRLFKRREEMHILLAPLGRHAEALAAALAAVEVEQVRADGTRPEFGRQKERFLQAVQGLVRYFADRGDVTVLLDRAQAWVEEITRHARRLSEQHLGSTVREQTLLELAARFAACPGLPEAEVLAQAVFAATLPLHWKGEAPPGDEQPAWSAPPVTVPLLAVRRGARRRHQPEVTGDHQGAAVQRMLAVLEARRRAEAALLQLFGPGGTVDLGQVTVCDPADRRLLLHLFYKAMSQQGRAGVGFRNWSVAVEVPEQAQLGELRGPDGSAVLPRVTLRLYRGAPP